MKEITNEQMLELMTDQEFAAKVKDVKTANDMLNLMAEHDIHLTEDELKEDCLQTIAVLKENGYMDGDELTERGLELVPGGAKWGRYASGLAIMGGGIGLTAIGAVCPPVGLLMLGCGAVGALCSLR